MADIDKSDAKLSNWMRITSGRKGNLIISLVKYLCFNSISLCYSQF